MNGSIRTTTLVIMMGLLLAPAAAGAAEKTVVFAVDGINVDKGLVRAASMTIAGELEGYGYEVVDHRSTELRLWRERQDEIDAHRAASGRVLVLHPYDDAEAVPADPAKGETAAAEKEGEAPPAPEAPVEATPPPLAEPAPAPGPAPRRYERDELQRAVIESIGCAYYVDGYIVRLGHTMKLRVALHKASGELVATRNMEARTEDDLPIVIPRLVKALVEQVHVEETLTLDNATRAETAVKAQRFSLEKNFGFSFGHAFGLGDLDSFVQIGFDGRFEFGDVLAEIDAGLGLTTEDADPAFVFDLAVGYYLTHTPIAPYLGFGAGMFAGDRMGGGCEESFDDWDDEDCPETSMVGWNLFPLLGIELLRHSRIRMHMDFRYLFSFSGDAFGHAPMLLVGMNF